MFAIDNFISYEVVQKIGWVLLHFVWQAAAVALVMAFALRVMRRFSANTRYIAACLALLIVVVMPFATMQFVHIDTPPSPIKAEAAPVINIEPVIVPSEVTFEAPTVEPVKVAYVEPEPVVIERHINWKERAVTFLEPKLSAIVTIWLFGVFALAIWHLGGYAQLQKLRKKMVKQIEPSLHEKLKVLAKKLGVTQSVELLESALVQIPTVVGWLKPVILLPASALTGLTTEQLEAILAHELAHIKRYDYLVNILQTIVEILGFYHPAVWWISHKIRSEREHCCDDIAVAICGDKIHYAKALASMEEIRGRNHLAVAATGGNLFSRICRLIGKDSSEKNPLSWIPALTVILLLIALAIPTTIAFTSSQNEDPNSEQIEKMLIDGFRENRDKFKCGILSWSRTTIDDGFSSFLSEKSETKGSFQLWWDGEKTSTKYIDERLSNDPTGQIRIHEYTGGNIYNGSLLSRKPKYSLYENWFEQVIRWTGTFPLDKDITEMKKLKNVSLDWSIVDNNEGKQIKLVVKNLNDGYFGVRYFDMSRGYNLIRDESHNTEGKLYGLQTRKLQKIGDGWFPVEVDIKSFDTTDGKIELHHNFTLDTSRCSFNESDNLPEGIFDFSTVKEHEQLNKIIEKYTKNETAYDDNMKNACDSVSNYITAVMSNQDEESVKFAYPESSISNTDENEQMREILKGQQLQLIAVYADDWNALVTTSVILADHGQIGPMVFQLKRIFLEQKEYWLIEDIDIETIDSIEEEYDRFLEEYSDAKKLKLKEPILVPLDNENNTNIQSENIDSGTKVLIEAQFIEADDIFLEQVGLDSDSLKNSNEWSQNRVDNSSNPFMFTLDSIKKESLLERADESRNTSSITNIFMMLMSDANKRVDQNNIENSLLAGNQTLLILGGKQISLQDIEKSTPILRNTPVISKFLNTISKTLTENNEIILIKTTIIPNEQDDDLKVLSDNIFTSEHIRVKFNLNLLEPGQYVEINNNNKREIIILQVPESRIGKTKDDFPAYAGNVDFEVRSNFDLNLTTKRHTRGMLLEHDNWDASFTDPNKIIGDGSYLIKTLMITAWNANVYNAVPNQRLDDSQANLVEVQIEPVKSETQLKNDNNADMQSGNFDPTTKILIEAQVIHANEDFLLQVGLDTNTNNHSTLTLDSTNKNALLQNIDDSKNATFASHIFMITSPGQEVTIKSGDNKFNSEKLGRFIKIKPELAQDGENVNINCNITTSQFKNIDSYSYYDKPEILETDIERFSFGIKDTLLTDNQTFLLPSGILVTLDDVNAPVPFTMYPQNTIPQVKAETNEIILIKATIIPDQQINENDDVAPNDLSDDVFTSRVFRVKFNLNSLEPGQYVEINNNDNREITMTQVACQSGREFPCYDGHADFDIRSNFDFNFITKLYTPKYAPLKKSSSDASFDNPKVTGDGSLSTKILTIGAWDVNIYNAAPGVGLSESEMSLVEVQIKPVKTDNKLETQLKNPELKDNFELLNIDFKPVHSGINEVYIKLKNKTDKGQIFRTVFMATSPDENGEHANTRVMENIFTVIEPQKTETVRAVYKFDKPFNEHSSLRLILFNPPKIDDQVDGYFFFYKIFDSNDLKASTKETIETSPANQTKVLEINRAFRRFQSLLQNQEYDKAWELLTEDYKIVEFHSSKEMGLEIFNKAMKQLEDRAFSTWDKNEFLKLLPGKVSYNDDTLYLAADYNDQHWTINFKMEDGQYKINWIDGYTSGFLRREQRNNTDNKIPELSLNILKSIQKDVAAIEKSFPELEGFSENVKISNYQNKRFSLDFEKDMGLSSKANPNGILNTPESCFISVTIQEHIIGQRLGNIPGDYPHYIHLSELNKDIDIAINVSSDELRDKLYQIILKNISPLQELNKNSISEKDDNQEDMIGPSPEEFIINSSENTTPPQVSQEPDLTHINIPVQRTFDISDIVRTNDSNTPDSEVLDTANKLTTLILELIEPETWYSNNPDANGTIYAYPTKRPEKFAFTNTVNTHISIDIFFGIMRTYIKDDTTRYYDIINNGDFWKNLLKDFEPIEILNENASTQNVIITYDVSDMISKLDDFVEIEIIKMLIAPDTWYENNPQASGTINIYPANSPKKIAVSQTPEVHKKIETFLYILQPYPGEEAVLENPITQRQNSAQNNEEGLIKRTYDISDLVSMPVMGGMMRGMINGYGNPYSSGQMSGYGSGYGRDYGSGNQMNPYGDGLMNGYGNGYGSGYGSGYGNMLYQTTNNRAEELKNLIMQLIEPKSWYEMDEKGKGTIELYPAENPKKMTVTNTIEVHQKIEKLLQAMRESLGNQVSLEIRYIYGTEQAINKIISGTSIEKSDNAILDDIQVSLLVRSTQANENVKSLVASRATVLDGEIAQFSANETFKISFGITPIITSNNSLLIHLNQNVIIINEQPIETFKLNREIPDGKTLAYICPTSKPVQNNQASTGTENMSLIVLVKPAMIMQGQTPTQSSSTNESAITTPENEQPVITHEGMVQRTYDITDLIDFFHRQSIDVNIPEFSTGMNPNNMIGGYMGGGMMVGLGGSYGGVPNEEIIEASNKLIKLVMERVEPDSWYEINDQAEGTIYPYPASSPKKLAVTNTPEVHNKIIKLFESIRNSSDMAMISIETRYIYTGEQTINKIINSIGIENIDGTILDDEQVKYLIRGTQNDTNTKSIAVPKVTILNGETARFESTNIFCKITPEVSEDKKEITLDITQTNPYSEQGPDDLISLSKIKVPDSKTYVYSRVAIDQQNPSSEKMLFIVLTKPTIIPQEEKEPIPGPDGFGSMMEENSEAAQEIVSGQSINSQQNNPKQVLIETQIVQVKKSFLEQLGLDANSLKNSDTWSKYSINESSEPNKFVIDELTATLLQQNIDASFDTKVTNKPVIIAQTGKQAKMIFDTETYLIYKASLESKSYSKQGQEKVTFGPSISFTPEIVNQNNVRLNSEFHILENIQQSTILKINDKQVLEGSMRLPKAVTLYGETIETIIPDGQTLLIIGNKISEGFSRESKVPILGDLPLLDRVFSNRSYIEHEYIQLFLIKPTIVFKRFNTYQPTFHDSIDPNDPTIKKLEKIFNERDKNNNPNTN